MSLVLAPGTSPRPVDWSDPAFFTERLGRSTNFWRLLWFLILPPDTNRTVPTPAGIILAFVALGLGLAAYNNANNVLFMALSLLLSSLVLSGLLSWVNFHGLRWRLVLPPRFRAGEPAPLRLELANRKKFVPTYSLLFRARMHRQLVDPANATLPLFLTDRLEPGGATNLDWIFSPQRRGLETVEITGVESLFPFGFLRKVIGGSVRHDVLVWPARVPYDFQLPQGFRARLVGETQRRPGPGADLLGLRTYRGGDAPRLIHWKASARARHLMVRQTGEEQRAGYFLVVEASLALWPDAGQFERLCSFAASLGEDLFTQGRLRGVSLNNEPLLPVKRLADLHNFFDRLARFEPSLHVAPAIVAGPNVITFQPGTRQQVHALLGHEHAGSA